MKIKVQQNSPTKQQYDVILMTQVDSFRGNPTSSG